jgi:putative membrane protein
MLKTALEKKLECVACVPHGVFGHEFDLASQIQNQKVINQVVELANHEVYENKATLFTKTSNELATVCCQVFGNTAFLSFTLAPKTTEDLPQELGTFAREESKKHGLNCCVVVNSHNSINGAINMKEALDALKTVLVTCLKEMSSLKQLPFEVGAATIVPREFGLRDGMGAGGITAVVVRVGQQKTAYVVIDGNNMVSGLREKILSALNAIGVDEGEVFTTDTHSVSALILGNRGYHPIGEAIQHDAIIEYVKKAVLGALSNLEPVRTTCNSIKIPKVKVIGEKQLEKLCLLIDNTLQKAKEAIVPLLVSNGLLLMLILMFV